jgi:hypothetical protein
MNKYHFILLVLLAQPAFAKEAKDKVSIEKDGSLSLLVPALEQSVSYEKTWNDNHPASEYDQYLKESLKTAIRAPANSENILSPKDLTKLRTDLYALASADALNDYIEKTVTPNYANYSADAKLVANQLIELHALRGFIYKMVPLVDQQKMAHSFLLTFVMRLATSISVYFPTYSQWTVGFNYIAEPYDGITEFNSIRDLQSFLNTTLYQAINDSDLRLRQIPIPEKGLVWDNTLLMNDNSYSDSFDRYVYVQDAERYAWLAGKQRAMARMKTFCAYGLNDVFAITNNIAKMQTEEVADGAIASLFDRSNGQTYVEGLSSKDRNDKINDAKYPYFGRLWKGGTVSMQQALAHYQQMVSDADRSWKFLDNKKTEYNHVFIQRGYADVFDRRASRVLPTWKDLLGLSRDDQLPSASLTTHPVVLTSHLEGTAKNPEKVKVDLIAFFNHPPTNLRTLLPTAYQANGQDAVWKVKGKYKYHNYNRGMANQWSYSAYQVLFPDLSKDAGGSGDKIKGFQRVLSQSWGGRFIGIPLAAFLY